MGSLKRVVSGEDILQVVAHRYENVLVDTVVFAKDRVGEFGELSLTVGSQDVFGRQIFSKQKKPGQWVILSTVFMEILALGSIVVSGRPQEGTLVLFAGITRFEKLGDIPLDVLVHGVIVKKKDKWPFFLCNGQLFVSEKKVVDGDMMAVFVDSKSDVATSVKKNSDIDLTPTFSESLVKNSDLKSEWMYVVDDLLVDDWERGRLLAVYQFPANHPLVKGHFPDRPVMMGVMQWMMVEDALLVAAFRWKRLLNRTGRYRVLGHADLVKKDGTSVCEVKGFEVHVFMDVPGYLNQTELVKTEKIAFRDAVIPGETLYIQLTQLQILNA